MSITRKLLKGMGLNDEQSDTIIEEHVATVDALKEQIAVYKADAEKLPDIQKELDALKNAGDDGYKEKYESEHKAFEDYKAEQTAKESRAAKETAYRALLAEAGIEKRVDTIMKVTDLESVELNQDGTIRGKDKLLESIKTEWADFITTTKVEGAPTPTPPSNADAGKAAYDALSLSEKMKYANEHPKEVEGWLRKE